MSEAPIPPPDDDTPSKADVLPELSLLPPKDPNRVPGMERWIPKYAQDTSRPYKGQPWDRQPNETAKQYSGFCIYRDMEPDERTFQAADRIYNERNGLSPNGSRMGRWAKTHRWEDRVEQYDAYMEAKKRRRLERRKLKAAERHADDAIKVQEILLRPIDALRKRLAEQGDQTIIDKLSDEELVKLSVAFGKELPGQQRAEREALASVDTGSLGDPKKRRAAGTLLRKIVENKDMRTLVEAMQVEVEDEQPTS